MLPEIKALEPELKQILYNCVEHVKATKAALYLSSSHDLNAKTFELVTSYQYNPADRKVINSSDDLVDRLAVKRSPFYVNGLAADQRFAEMQFRQGTDRMLATPLFARGRLVGFIDMRDKAGKKPFESPDLDAAKRIGDEVISFLSARNLFGLSPSTHAQTAEKPLPVSAVEMARPTPSAPPPGRTFTPEASQVIEASHEYLTKRQHATSSERRILTDSDLEAIHLLLPAALAIPSAVLASFTALGHLNNPQSIVAIATVMDDAQEMLHGHLQAWLERMNYRLATMKPRLIYPFGVQVVPVTAAGISTILSAPVNPQSVEGLVLTVAFERTPEAQAQRALQIFLRQIEQSVETAMGITAGRIDRQVVAEKLLEPDFQKIPELTMHAREVATIAQRFAKVLDLPPHLAETIRITALVHDVGMRLLDYERLYRRPSLTAEEVRGMAEHPIVGAALVEPLLGPEIAQAVLRHHERVDGKGYPSRLSGHQIPLASRVVQICDAWVAMTSAHSYQITIEPTEAVKRLREGSGSQFDQELLAKFLDSLGEITDL
ncbi:MAG: HD-GYP domain-containing protein [Thermoanaerobaculia bacterium]